MQNNMSDKMLHNRPGVGGKKGGKGGSVLGGLKPDLCTQAIPACQRASIVVYMRPGIICRDLGRSLRLQHLRMAEIPLSQPLMHATLLIKISEACTCQQWTLGVPLQLPASPLHTPPSYSLIAWNLLGGRWGTTAGWNLGQVTHASE